VHEIWCQKWDWILTGSSSPHDGDGKTQQMTELLLGKIADINALVAARQEQGREDTRQVE
jgi:hypothetical protein